MPEAYQTQKVELTSRKLWKDGNNDQFFPNNKVNIDIAVSMSILL